MPKYAIEASFSLTTEIECEISSYTFDSSEVEDFEDNSNWGSQEISEDGGSLTFTVEADSEHDAERQAEEVVFDGQEITDGNDWAWLVENVSISIEEIEEEMNLVKACEIVQERINGWPDSDPLKGAMTFLLDYIQRTPFSG